MQIAVLGIDLGKNSCSIVGFDDGGAVVLRRRMRREGVIKLAAQAEALRRGDGGVLRGASSRPCPAAPGPRGAADVAGICPPLRQGAEER